MLHQRPIMRIGNLVAELIVRFVIGAQLLPLPFMRVPAFRDVVLHPCVVVAEELREVGLSGVVVCVVGLEIVAPPIVGWGLAVASHDTEHVACDAVLGLLPVLVFGWSGPGAGT